VSLRTPLLLAGGALLGFAALIGIAGFVVFALFLAPGWEAREEDETSDCSFLSAEDVEAVEELLLRSVEAVYGPGTLDAVESSLCSSDDTYVVRGSPENHDTPSRRQLLEALEALGWVASHHELEVVALSDVDFRQELTPSTRAVLHLVDWETGVDAELRVTGR
jgi:hypothetical protein